MTKKFAARYTANDELSHMITAMKQARKSSGYSQLQFGKLVGISRETVVHIEGLVECTVLSLECGVLKRWFSVCASRISAVQRDDLQKAINAWLFSSVLFQTDTGSDLVPISVSAATPAQKETAVANGKTQKQKVA